MSDASHFGARRDIHPNGAGKIRSIRIIGGDISFLHRAGAPRPFLCESLNRSAAVGCADVIAPGREINQTILTQVVGRRAAGWLQLLSSTDIREAHRLYLHRNHRIAVLIQHLARNDALRSHLDGQVLHLHSRREIELRAGGCIGAGAVSSGDESGLVGRQRVAAGSNVIKDEFAGVVRGFAVAGRRLAGLSRAVPCRRTVALRTGSPFRLRMVPSTRILSWSDWRQGVCAAAKTRTRSRASGNQRMRIPP